MAFPSSFCCRRCCSASQADCCGSALDRQKPRRRAKKGEASPSPLFISIDKGLKHGYTISFIKMMPMIRLNKIRKMFLRITPVLLAGILLVVQASTILASPVASCLPGTGSVAPFAPPQNHRCCCGDMETCCCHVGQGPTATLPDMALPAIAGGEYNPATLYAALETGSQAPLLPQILTPAGRWTGTGPPLSLSYLVNLTLRC